MNPLRIFLIGQVSTGKSSFINALAGGFVSCASLQRETTNPEIYKFTQTLNTNSYLSIANILHKKHVDNNNIRTNTEVNIKSDSKPIYVTDKEGKELEFNTPLIKTNIELYDFPGLNDSDTGSNDLFFDMVKNNISVCDHIIFMTQAKSAFVHSHELDLFKKIKTLVDTHNNDGNFMSINIVVNMFDDVTDPDLNEIFNRIQSKVGSNIDLFRVSSHILFMETIKRQEKKIPVPKFMDREIRMMIKNSGMYLDKTGLKYLNEKRWLIVKHLHALDKSNMDSDEEPTLCEEEVIDEEQVDDTIINKQKPVVINSNYGDWDHLIGCIECYCEKITENKVENVLKCLNGYVDNINKKYESYNTHYNKFVQLLDIIDKINVNVGVKKNSEEFNIHGKIFYFSHIMPVEAKIIRCIISCIQNLWSNEEQIWAFLFAAKTKISNTTCLIMIEITKFRLIKLTIKNNILQDHQLLLWSYQLYNINMSPHMIKQTLRVLSMRKSWTISTNKISSVFDHHILSSGPLKIDKYNVVINNILNFNYGNNNIPYLLNLCSLTNNEINWLRVENKQLLGYDIIKQLYGDERVSWVKYCFVVNKLTVNDVPIIFCNINDTEFDSFMNNKQKLLELLK
jgi:GTPase Era involved in 16S rRNA processing